MQHGQKTASSLRTRRSPIRRIPIGDGHMTTPSHVTNIGPRRGRWNPPGPNGASSSFRLCLFFGSVHFYYDPHFIFILLFLFSFLGIIEASFGLRLNTKESCCCISCRAWISVFCTPSSRGPPGLNRFLPFFASSVRVHVSCTLLWSGTLRTTHRMDGRLG